MAIDTLRADTAIICISKRGIQLGSRLKLLLEGSHLYLPEKWGGRAATDVYSFSMPVKEVVADTFGRYRHLVLIMAAGIAVRSIAGALRDKVHDPAVVVMDDSGAFAVSLLSGHEGGANKLAQKVASLTGARPVITTASDASGTVSVDLLGREFGWEIEDRTHVTAASAAAVNGDLVGIYQEAGERNWRHQNSPLPENVKIFESFEALCQIAPRAALVITDRVLDGKELDLLPRHTVVYRPKSLVVGIGCNRGTKSSMIEEAIAAVFSEYGISFKSVRNLATIDVKKNEAGLLEFAEKYRLQIEYFDSESLRRAGFSSMPSALVEKHVGTPAVCESAAILSSGSPALIVPKKSHAWAVTVAVSRLPEKPQNKTGRLFLIGIGPGSHEHMTLRAREAIEESDVVVGYTSYIKLLEPFVRQKEVISTGMGAEVERARMAVNLAKDGRKVAFVSSGDSGIYGMAGLVGEMLREQPDGMPELEVVPGVTALVAAAALLGSPLNVDFAVISLSDYLVTWEVISRRLRMAAEGDFVTVLYNPRSRKRQRQLPDARNIFLKHRSPSTPVGIVTNAYRGGQEVIITTLEKMLEHDIGMDTIVFIGNLSTSAASGWIVTPRGYKTKYSLEASE